MRVWLSIAALLLVGLAGCADEPAAKTDEDEFDDVDLDIDENTGAIIGVVVDERITPVAGAAVKSTGGSDLETITDEQGRFSFDQLAPGTYFFEVSKDLYESVQVSTQVVAGVEKPPVLNIQLPRLFEGEPYMVPIHKAGFFTCSQGGMPGYLYGSSPCTSLYAYNADGVTAEERTFHADVNPGWQSMIFEMTWKPSAQGTSDRMGVVISTEKSTRSGTHSFANYVSESPMWLELKVGEQHPSGAGEAPAMVPAEGMKDMSYFMSVRPPEGASCVLWWCAPPGLALDQKFDTYLHQFYYGKPPEGWSVVNGDTDPFTSRG